MFKGEAWMFIFIFPARVPTLQPMFDVHRARECEPQTWNRGLLVADSRLPIQGELS